MLSGSHYIKHIKYVGSSILHFVSETNYVVYSSGKHVREMYTP